MDSYESQVKESAPSLFRSKERFKATINDRYKETTDTQAYYAKTDEKTGNKRMTWKARSGNLPTSRKVTGASANSISLVDRINQRK